MKSPALLLTGLVLLGLLTGCPEPEPLKLGFIGGLTGRYAGLGTAGRNGVIYAVEQLNRQGGLNGRPVVLLLRDDHQEQAAAIRGVQELHAAGAAALIGPLTSEMAVAAAAEADRLGLVMVGPTISTNELSGRDDHFFRIRPASRHLAEALARHLVEATPIRRLGVACDLSNRAHSESWLRQLQAAFEARGGRVVATHPFNSSDNPLYSDIARQLLATKADALFILAGGLDTALLSQQLRKQGSRHPLYASEWSFTRDLLQHGGATVEGMTVIHTFDPSSTRPEYVAFRDSFRERFGEEPGFAAAHSYDAAGLLFAALARNPDPARLRETLKTITTFEGVQTTLRFDAYGDVERKLFLTRVIGGRFVPQEQE